MLIYAPMEKAVQCGEICQGRVRGKEVPLRFVAPIDLLPGDLCLVDLATGGLCQVLRFNWEIWPAERWLN